MLPSYAALPTISSFSPTSGPVGTRITINGTGLGFTTAVEFNGTPATFTKVSAFQLQAVVPVGATTGKIRVYNYEGYGESTGDFNISAGITSFSPLNGTIGSTVVISGSNLTGTTQVNFNGVSATEFTVDSDSQITATVPEGATSGPISIVAPSGPVTSTTNFRIIPRIDSVTPVSGPSGTEVIISGRSFTGAIIVRFNYVSTTYVVDNDNQITAPVPANVTAGPLMVTTREGTGYSTFSFYPTSETNDGTPTITNVTAAQVGGVTTITGTNFGGTVNNAQPTDVSVTFTALGGGTISAVPNSTTTNISSGVSTAKVTVPHGATHGPVTITTPMGTASSAGIKDFILTPKITAYTPGSGAEGDTITIEGTGLYSDSSATGTLAVPVVQFYNGRIVPAEDVTPDPESPYTRLTAKVPTLAQTGAVVVKTSSQSGGVNSATGTPIFYVAPFITSISPETGPAGTVVVINGRNFIQNATQVKFTNNIGISPYSIKFVSTARLDVTLPSHSGLANGPVAVTTAYGTAESPQWFVVHGNVPTITGFTPTHGPVGTTVTITGTNFTPPTSTASAVYFYNGRKALNYEFVSATEIRVDVPPSTVAGPIKVYNIAGQSAWSTADYAPAAPTVTAVTGYSGSYTGPISSRVAIGGNNFTRNSVVNFAAEGGGTVAGANQTYSSYTTLYVDVPEGAVPGPITVTNDAGTSAAFGVSATYPEGVWFVPEGQVPEITGLSTQFAPVGTVLTITGRNFTPQVRATNQVLVGSGKYPNGTVQFISSEEIRATIPTATLAGPVRVLNYAGWSAHSTLHLATALPGNTAFSPTSGPAGTMVRITSSGSQLTPDSKVLFTSATGTIEAADFVYITNTYADVKVPEDAITGKLYVTNPAGTSAASTGTFTVVSSAAPRITAASPQVGNTGDTVVITGSNFTGATAVKFYSAKTATFTVDSDTQITATVPASIANYGPITVTNAAGTATSAFHFVKTGIVPVISTSSSSISPNYGPTGTRVAIAGANFTPDSLVHFSGASGPVLANNISYYSYSTIYVDVPANAAVGPVTVTNAAGTSAPSLYWFVPEGGVPTITSLSPVDAAVGQEITILGSNFEPNSKTTVYFLNGKYSRPTAAQFVSANEIRITVPAGALSGPIKILNTTGYSAWSTQDYVAGAPTLTSWSSNSGTNTGPTGTTINIAGNNLTRDTVINFTGASGSVAGVNPVWISYNSMRVDVPSGARIGPLTATTSAGTSAPSAVWFVPTGDIPTVTSFSPTSGPTGTVVTVTGTNFTPQSRVYFGSRADAGIIFVSPTEIHGKVPSNAATTPQFVRVLNAAGYSLNSTATFTRTP